MKSHTTTTMITDWYYKVTDEVLMVTTEVTKQRMSENTTENTEDYFNLLGYSRFNLRIIFKSVNTSDIINQLLTNFLIILLHV